MDSVEKLIYLYFVIIFFVSNECGMVYICYLLFFCIIILLFLILFVMYV